MNGVQGVFQGTSPGAQAPKRSNSGREIVYIQHNRLVGSGQPVQDQYIHAQQPIQVSSPEIPHDVMNVFNTVLRQYSYRDIHRWLKMDRESEIGRSSVFPPDHLPYSMARPPMPGSARSSRTSSVFSMPQGYDRNSYASSRTSYSMISEHSEEPVMSPNSMISSVSMDGSIMNRNSTASRSSTVSNSKQAARQRENDLEIKKRYFCTACNKGFARKYDWKVHEQRYHEQQFQYPCPDCNQILYAETHFRSHHRDAHGCQQCTHAKEVTKEVDPRHRRTAWGCGFCAALLDDWEKRCDHISQHYDEGQKRTEWDHSKVILGLLRQDGIDAAWQNLLISKHGQVPNPPLAVRFSKETTSRSHGDSLQLQDMLELGAIGRDIDQIVQLAYEQGVRNPPPEAPKQLESVKEEETSSISPPTDAPQDSVMGSPSMDSKQLPQQSNGSYNFVSSPMEFTSQPQDVMQSPMLMENPSMSSVFTFNSNGFSEPMYQNNNFVASHQSMPTFQEKELPPIPVEHDVSMMPNQNQNQAQAPFDQWGLMSNFTNDGSGMVMATFDPRNQF